MPAEIGGHVWFGGPVEDELQLETTAEATFHADGPDADSQPASALEAGEAAAAAAVADAEAAGAPADEVARLRAAHKKMEDRLSGVSGRWKQEREARAAAERELAELRRQRALEQQRQAQLAAEQARRGIDETVAGRQQQVFNQYVQQGYDRDDAERMAKAEAGLLRQALSLQQREAELERRERETTAAKQETAMERLIRQEREVVNTRLKKRGEEPVTLYIDDVTAAINTRYAGQEIGPAEVTRMVRELVDDALDARANTKKTAPKARAAAPVAPSDVAAVFEGSSGSASSAWDVYRRYGTDPNITLAQAKQAEKTLKALGRL